MDRVRTWCGAAETINDRNERMRLTAVDLFAGAGGFSLGAVMVGFSVVAAVETDAHAAETYRRNLLRTRLVGGELVERDVRELDPAALLRATGLDPGACDLLLGGPPCQGFSLHRRQAPGPDDDRNLLLSRYLDFARVLRPRYLLVENVPGLLHGRHADRLAELRSEACALGYGFADPAVLNARDFGVPQNRRRVFLLGWDRARAPVPAWPPVATHVDPRRGRDGRPAWLTASAVFDRPAIPGDRNDVHMRHGAAVTSALDLTPRNGGSRADSGRTLPCHEGHDGHGDVYGRIDPSRPGPTMTAACTNPSKGRFVHPVRNHGITLRQAARFQGFPDWFEFEGGLKAGASQVGNAVPVPLARAVLAPIRETLRSMAVPGAADVHAAAA